MGREFIDTTANMVNSSVLICSDNLNNSIWLHDQLTLMSL